MTLLYASTVPVLNQATTAKWSFQYEGGIFCFLTHLVLLILEQ